jgi:hypothetical protein
VTIKRWTVLTVIALTCGSAWATPLGTVTARYDSYFTDGTMTVWGGGRSNLRIQGGLYWIDNDASAATGLGTELSDGLIPVFCIDLQQGIRGGLQTYDVVRTQDAADPGTYIPGGPAMGAVRADYLSELWGRYFGTAVSSEAAAEAFAASVWEILYEELPSKSTDWDVTIGPGFRATGLNSSLANAWLHSLGDDFAPRADLGALSHPLSQDFITEFPVSVVPEPLTCSLVGLGAFALLRKRR